ncbi:MAG: CRISPR-associated protein Cas5 [Candidatus Omnitrophica bacterium]|nr:CRISPR-associated protein Cas5 [Candidatus Omnitrophota bacterium]
MQTLVFDIRLNSLYSIRIPFTWQSALTYPFLPPSAVIGLIANALQRYKNNKPPSSCLEQVENDVLWAGSRLLRPCVIKSYNTSAIIKWEDVVGGKFTNVLCRQFAFTIKIQIATVFKENSNISEISQALQTTPLTAGDSESCISVESEPLILDTTKREIQANEEVETFFPLPFDTELYQIKGEGGKIFLVHPRCRKLASKNKSRKNKAFKLHMYLFPLKEKQGIISPCSVVLKIKKPTEVYFAQNLALISQKI